MRPFFIISSLFISATLASCSSLPGVSNPPYYDYQKRAIIAKGYPIERVDMPPGFHYFSASQDYTKKDPSMASNSGNITEKSYRFVWKSNQDGSRLMDTEFSLLELQTRYKLPDTSGYQFIGGKKVRHVFMSTSAARSDPKGIQVQPFADGCGIGVELISLSPDSRYLFAGTYLESITCQARAAMTEADWQVLLERAYRIYGMK
ncbi:hypothetical protein [Halomonas binhaiensis]|uniref:DUF3313 domain-containing protein n=1 Tax=Halomonas binhaiensis TaxID=2562282 RepID=A0A5C1NCR2_9GAMM|nr:hypothetical protein [Halomonas binhaiensis]QEM81462.1 hypothetical protein E4T21_07830 [Halomonas binhaiensis]